MRARKKAIAKTTIIKCMKEKKNVNLCLFSILELVLLSLKYVTFSTI